MTDGEIGIVDFGFEEDLLERFLRVEETVYADDPVWGHLPPRDLAPQLAPGHPFFADGGEHRCFLALSPDDVARGRAAAMVSPRLEDEAGRPLGLVGFFEATDDEAVWRPLLEAAFAWLRARGVAQVLGPMDGSTYYRYRFVTSGFERGPFLLEPYNPPWYGAAFEAVGFAPYRTYVSIKMRHLEDGPLLARAYQRAVKAGVRFEALDAESFQARLPVCYDLSRRIFAGKTAYSDVTYDEFQALYGRAGALVRPGLCHLAYDPEGAPLGFFFGYPDLLEPLRAGDPSAPVTTTILKSLAVAPEGPGWLGWALTHLHTVAALEQGYRFGIYALMEKYEQLLRYADKTGRSEDGGGELKRYTLFARDLT